MKQGEWLGLPPTVTDDIAKQYAADKFGVPAADIELQRDAIVKVRPKQPAEQEVELPSFDEWMYDTFGFPDENDEHYLTYQQFGYRNWLIKAYPDEFASGELVEINGNLKQEYYWHILAMFLGLDENIVEDALEESLRGQCIIIPSAQISLKLHFENALEPFGFLIWEEGTNSFCVFVDEDGDYIPAMVPSSEIEVTDEIFDGWEEG